MAQSLLFCILFLLFQPICGYGGEGGTLATAKSADYHQMMCLIQEGRMASVYLGYEAANPDVKVAIRVVSHTTPPAYYQQELEGLRLQQSISHRNILVVNAIGRTALGDLVAVFPYMPDGDLCGLINTMADRQVWLSEPFVVDCAKAILAGVGYLHSQKIIHRDVKPENILCGAEPRDLKITDFGFALFLPDGKKSTNRLGTTAYMAPSVYRGEEYGFEVDCWSAMVVFFTLATYEFPFKESRKSSYYMGEIPSRCHLSPKMQAFFEAGFPACVQNPEGYTVHCVEALLEQHLMQLEAEAQLSTPE